jgi:hypothetical protein
VQKTEPQLLFVSSQIHQGQTAKSTGPKPIERNSVNGYHFVDPAPEILITKPRFEATLRAPHVSIEVESEPKSDRKVVRYRWFIDNRLVAETKQPRYVWDTRGERTGHHFITVHAVDDAWNREATQIPVQLERTSPTVR